MTDQHVNMSGSGLYYIKEKSLAFGGNMDAYMCQARIHNFFSSGKCPKKQLKQFGFYLEIQIALIPCEK